MDIQKDYTCIEHNVKVFSKAVELEADYQEALPAYCDDIFRVVKCVGRSYITSTDISYNEIKLFGKYEICLTYYNENSRLCYADFEEDFSKTVSVDEIGDSAFVCADIFDKYTNFRVINQRRIDVHSSSVICLSVYDKIKCPEVCSCENSKLRYQNFKIADVISSDISRIEFDEEFSLPSSNEAINRIISWSAFASLSEIKIIKDKALIKASVTVNILYTADNSEENIEKLQYSFNTSKIIDSLGINENDIPLSNICIGSMFVKGKASGGDKVNTVDVFGELSVNTVFIREYEQEYITDGYIPGAVTDNSFSEYTISEAAGIISENKIVNASVNLPDDVSSVLELSLITSEISFKNGKLTSKLNINALCVSESGELISVSSGDEFVIPVNSSNEGIASFSINSYDYTLTDRNTMDIRVNMKTDIYTLNNKTVNILSDIVATDEKKEASTMTVYFAKANESVWDIAKSFSSDIDMIISENSLNGDTLDADKVLIIPRA